MNLARWIIVGSLVASAALGANGWRLHRDRVELEQALKVQVPKLAQDIQALSRKYSKLFKEAEREGLRGQDDPQSYIRGLAQDPNVSLGAVDIRPQSPTNPIKGVVDKRYVISPQDKNRGFSKDRIANYMWLLEQQSRRVRVTNIRFEQEQKLKPWEFGDDLRWKWEIEVTSRQKEELAPAQ